MYRLCLFALGTILATFAPNIRGGFAEVGLPEANVDSTTVPVSNEASIID